MRKMNKILSFDISSVSTGWSLLEDDKLVDFGVIAVPAKCSTQNKLAIFKYNVRALLKIHMPDYVVIEETYLKNVKTLKALMQFIGVANMECFEVLNKEPVFLNTMTVRSFFGLKNKESVFYYIQDKYKRKLKNYTFEEGNDITDSILQALYWWLELISKEKKNG
jgi:Holliday junction resolvasome RuvABC endonuclease subunit